VINLHIIGAQKSGTSALAHFIDQHSDAFVVKGKEAHVFDNPLFLKSNTKMHWANKRFEQVLNDYQNQTVCCDATPITMFDTQFLTHCFNYNPQAKFIVLLRDPVQRAISHYNMSKGRLEETLNPLLAFILESKRLKLSNSWQFNSARRTQSYLRRGLYSKQLQTLYKIVPHKQVLVLFNEDLRENHQGTMSSVFKFLSIQDQDIPQQSVFESERQVLKPLQKSAYAAAKLYANLYFWWHNESRKSCLKVIKHAQRYHTKK